MAKHFTTLLLIPLGIAIHLVSNHLYYETVNFDYYTTSTHARGCSYAVKEYVLLEIQLQKQSLLKTKLLKI